MEGTLSDKVAIVTGGGRGIDRAIAVALGHQGASVVVDYAENDAAASETVAKIEAAGSRALAVNASWTASRQCAHYSTRRSELLGAWTS